MVIDMSPNAKEVIMTVDELSDLEMELEDLKVVKRKEIAEKIKQAMAFGDLSENAEYDEAKNEQAAVETRIVQIEKLLKGAKVIDEDDVDTQTVNIGTKIKILDIEFNEEEEYTIVGSTGADPSKMKLSYESPVGSALLGKKVGEVVSIEVPAGIVQFKVLEIAK